ncbi:hypothetical protein AAX05_09350 [Moraxella bovoculi]|uniref:Uncharacterized protein n=1 Tax=Moraxella bovoculi TaxID=386891 RepID=A0AAC8TAB1_9GAMM|nr:hypothetical protein [Moraxella bovoculi]AKG08466.1 hypothetical protein AAX06_10340 [Moraxella bovoculi]AKG10304.1 hypothetical protein AAX05_09350 [Moraxella bovoculi]AKG12328.1 hypothetical protein AAX07_10585 [Moraxella bovoculi]AKG14290.1 hypothetical protein AAX11_10035 [Moraxella bovoculi]
MPIYTKDKLEQDISNKIVEYVADSVSDMKQKEIDYINNSDYKWIYDEQIRQLELDIHKSILSLPAYYPKTYQHLNDFQLNCKLTVYWYQLTELELDLRIFFELNQRIYFLTESRRDDYNWLPDHLKDGWLKAFGGVLLSDSVRYIQGGTMLIGDPYSCWKAFDIYLPNSRKKAKQAIESLVKKIPYAFIDIEIEGIEKQEKYRTDGFPNLRVMIDCRKPDEDPKEYDLILMCYYYDHRMFWVKDGDFINGIYEINNPQEMLDEYFLHVFSQVGEDYSRFDFSPWAKKYKP